MKNYITASLETHLFFARIMKEHAFFLEAGFPCKEKTWIERADAFREDFECILRETTEMSNGFIRNNVLKSQELVTCFTIPAEERTGCLTGVPFDTKITRAEQRLQPECKMDPNTLRQMLPSIHQLNEKALHHLNGLIEFKEAILREVKKCQLFTANYPLLIQHILREARLYRSILTELIQRKHISRQSLKAKEEFWNQIMMEHALFIRGLLDPCEEELIETADNFAKDYKKLLEMAKSADCRTMDTLTQKTLKETMDYRKFKSTGTEGILDCKISSIILPLLADHVLREANHYIRILEEHS